MTKTETFPFYVKWNLWMKLKLCIKTRKLCFLENNLAENVYYIFNPKALVNAYIKYSLTQLDVA